MHRRVASCATSPTSAGWQVRAHVNGIKARLEGGLAVLAATASGSAAFTAEHLEELGPLATPLLASPLVGEAAAWAAVRAMAAALPRGLGSAAATPVTTSLRLVAPHAVTGVHVLESGTIRKLHGMAWHCRRMQANRAPDDWQSVKPHSTNLSASKRLLRTLQAAPLTGSWRPTLQCEPPWVP